MQIVFCRLWCPPPFFLALLSWFDVPCTLRNQISLHAGLHDLAKVDGRQLVSTSSQISDTLLTATSKSPAGCLESESAAAIRDRLAKDARSSPAFRSHLKDLEVVTILRDEVKVLSVDPLAASEATRPEDDTTEVLLVASALTQELGTGSACYITVP